MKRGIILAVICTMLCTLTGCLDAMPDMSDEENGMIAEYCASLLMKYSPNFHNRLVDEDELARALFEEEREETPEETQETSPEEPKQEEKPAEPAKESQEETSDTQESVNSETIQVEAELEDSMPHASEMDIASLLGIEGFEIRYTDYELTDTYPKDGEGFTVSASKDNTLMVLHFSLTNVSGDSLICDLFDANPDIRVNVNEAGYQKVENTFLMNDITTYYEELPKNQSVDVVTILEISNTAVESIDLQIASTEMFVE